MCSFLNNILGFDKIDLLIHQNSHLKAFEFKLNDAPTIDKRWPRMVDELDLAQLTIIYPGKAYYPLTNKIGNDSPPPVILALDARISKGHKAHCLMR